MNRKWAHQSGKNSIKNKIQRALDACGKPKDDKIKGAIESFINKKHAAHRISVKEILFLVILYDEKKKELPKGYLLNLVREGYSFRARKKLNLRILRETESKGGEGKVYIDDIDWASLCRLLGEANGKGCQQELFPLKKEDGNQSAEPTLNERKLAMAKRILADKQAEAKAKAEAEAKAKAEAEAKAKAEAEASELAKFAIDLEAMSFAELQDYIDRMEDPE